MIAFSLIFLAMIIIVSIVTIGGFAFYMKQRTERLRRENNNPRFDFPPQPPSVTEIDEDFSRRNNA